MVSNQIRTLNKKVDTLSKLQLSQEVSLQHEFECMRQSKDLGTSITALVGLLHDFLKKYDGVSVVWELV